jgi:uncharacterized protein (TIGR03067 family)
MRHTITLAAFAITLSGAAADDQKPKQTEKPPAQPVMKQSLEGTYTILSVEREGKPAPLSETDGSTVVITKTAIMGTDKDKKEFFSATYTLDLSKTPARISMTRKVLGKDRKMTEETSAGIVKWDMDKVTIAYALPGGKPPTEFKAGDKQQMIVLRIKQN